MHPTDDYCTLEVIPRMTAQGDLTVIDTVTRASNSIYIMLSDNSKGASEKVFLLNYHRDTIESKVPIFLIYKEGKYGVMEL